ncbi:MAG TPA: carboxymuconolactone decarboxylase family protein [Vicinamibacterales bacterium]|nr:carboxymuconolactone decarboxylase family protein [Vicinamibacterales bacterium]
MEARMKNPAGLLPNVMDGIKALNGAVYAGGVSPKTLALAHMRASQINGCGVCIDGGAKHAIQGGETAERLLAVAGWRDAPYFTDAERAALALTEAVTRVDDRSDPVPDEVWADAAKHYDEKGLAALLLSIGMTNLFNRLNVATRQVAGSVSW